MQQVSRIGLDIAKHWFQVHAVTEEGKTVYSRKLSRDDVLNHFARFAPCNMALEAGGSAHYRAREIGKSGHRVCLIPPAYVKPCVKRGKNDTHDAWAICEAASRPDMRFVPVKSDDQQAALLLHTTRQLMVERRTALINSLRGQLAEFGVIAAQGLWHARQLINVVSGGTDASLARLPSAVLEILTLIAGQVQESEKAIAVLDQKIKD